MEGDIRSPFTCGKEAASPFIRALIAFGIFLVSFSALALLTTGYVVTAPMLLIGCLPLVWSLYLLQTARSGRKAGAWGAFLFSCVWIWMACRGGHCYFEF